MAQTTASTQSGSLPVQGLCDRRSSRPLIAKKSQEYLAAMASLQCQERTGPTNSGERTSFCKRQRSPHMAREEDEIHGPSTTDQNGARYSQQAQLVGPKPNDSRGTNSSNHIILGRISENSGRVEGNRNASDTTEQITTLENASDSPPTVTTGFVVCKKNSFTLGRHSPHPAIGIFSTLEDGSDGMPQRFEESRKTSGGRFCYHPRQCNNDQVVHGRNSTSETKRTDLAAVGHTNPRANPCEVGSGHGRQFATFEGHQRSTCGGNEIDSRSLHSTLVQTRGFTNSPQSMCGGQVHFGTVPIHGETQERHTAPRSNVSEIQRKGPHGTRNQNAATNLALVTSVSSSLIRWPRRGTERPTEEELRDFDLHTVKVAKADTIGIIRAAGDFRLSQLWDEIERITEPTCEENRESELEERDIEQLLLTQLAKEVDRDTMATAIAKSTSERRKRRRRFLVWPRLLNQNFDYTPQVHLKKPDEVIDEVLENPLPSHSCTARHFDLTSAFHQNDIGDNLRRHLIFQWRGRKFAMLKLPMGARFSPEVQQRITQWLANVAIFGYRVTATVHIDNVRFYGESGEVEQTALNFMEICKKFNVTLNDTAENEAEFDFLGINFDYARRQVCLSKNFCEKLSGINWEESTTWSNVMSIFGKLFFAAAVLKLPLYRFFYAIKLYRVISHNIAKAKQVDQRENPGDTPIKWWAQSLADAKSWCNMCSTNRRAKVEKESDEYMQLYTDASDTGFGLVLLTNGDAISTGERWSDSRPWNDSNYLPSINQREAYAVEAGKRWVESMFGPGACANIHLCIDNTTALFAWKKMYHRNFFINQSLKRANAEEWASVSYVKSVDNLADHQSRHPTSDHLLEYF